MSFRRSLSLPLNGKKKPGGGNKQEEKVLLSKVLVPYKQFQSGGDLANGAYKVGAHIAAGADGDVFRAVNTSTKKEVAVKRIRVTSAVIQRHVHQEVAAVFNARKKYAEEADDLDAIGHPCIVGYLDWFAGPGGLDREIFLAMELCNFGIGDLIHTGHVMRTEYEKMVKTHVPLEQLKAASKGRAVPVAGVDPKLYRFPERELLKVLFQMSSALAFLNRHGIFHRDVKSENILWKHDGLNEGFYKLADFGVAFCQADSEVSKRTDDCGTLWTMAPELLGRRPGAGPSCDIWSLAVVLFEMAFYEKPFTSLELLAYRNSGADSFDGFWQSLCPEKKTTGSSPVPRWGASSPANPSSPKSPAGNVGFRRGTSLPFLRAGESPSTPSSPVQRPPSGRPSAPSSPAGKLGKALARRKEELNASAPVPLQSLSRQGTNNEDEPTTPATPASSVFTGSAEALKARKRAFLRKRGSLRWIYSEELRNMLFEDMLDEDAAARPSPADLLASSKFQSLLAGHDISRWSTSEDLARCSTHGITASIRPQTPSMVNMRSDPDLRPTSAKSAGSVKSAGGVPSDAPPADCSSSTGSAVFQLGCSPDLAGNTLCRLTPEAFLAVLKVDRKFDAAVYSQKNYEAESDGVLQARPVELT